MAKKTKIEKDATNADLDTCFLSGVSFYENASTFFESLPQDENEAARFAIAERGRFFVASTNLALAVELLLKALAIARKRKVVPEHTLDVLFSALPSDYQASVERAYREKIAVAPSKVCKVLRIYFTPVGKPMVASGALPSLNESSSVLDVLRAERDAFMLWRYIHESGNPNGTNELTIQHYYLRLVAAAIVKHFALDPQSQRIVKTFCFSEPSNA